MRDTSVTGGATPTSFETRVADWLDVDEAVNRILAHARALPHESVSLEDALGRALSGSVVASATLPPWDNSAMDGYAVRSADIQGASPERPVALQVVGQVRAGAASRPRVESGQAVRIMTGAPVPGGADGVVRVEDTDREAEAGTVRIRDDRDAGGNVRPGGEDVRRGDEVLAAGATIQAGTIGVLAALGLTHVDTARRPVVAILATGDELLPADRYDEVREGRGIPESNGPMLAAAVTAAGGIPRRLPVVPDDASVLREALEEAAAADVIVSIGGASMGEADLVKRVLDDLAFDLDFWRVRMRPGSPVGFGHLPRGRRRVPLFSLPGNPQSAYVTFELFVRPFLRALAGHVRGRRPRITCRAGERLVGTADLAYFLRVSLAPGSDRDLVATTTGPQGSGLVAALGAVDGLAVIPRNVATIEPGDDVEVILLGHDLA